MQISYKSQTEIANDPFQQFRIISSFGRQYESVVNPKESFRKVHFTCYLYEFFHIFMQVSDKYTSSA